MTVECAPQICDIHCLGCVAVTHHHPLTERAPWSPAQASRARRDAFSCQRQGHVCGVEDGASRIDLTTSVEARKRGMMCLARNRTHGQFVPSSSKGSNSPLGKDLPCVCTRVTHMRERSPQIRERSPWDKPLLRLALCFHTRSPGDQTPEMARYTTPSSTILPTCFRHGLPTTHGTPSE